MIQYPLQFIMSGGPSLVTGDLTLIALLRWCLPGFCTVKL